MPSATEIVTAWFADSPFVARLGLKLGSVEDGRAEVVLPYDETVTTMGDVVHGGAVGALIDTAATVAAWAGAEAPQNLRGTTVGLTVTYVAAARASELTASARVVRRGKSLCFCEVDVADAGGETVAKALVTYKLG